MTSQVKLQKHIKNVQERIGRTAKLYSQHRYRTSLAVLHGDGVVGNQWCSFIQKLLIDELPEEYRDMNLELSTENVTNLGDDEICDINKCDYKMLLLDTEVLKILKDKESIFRNSEVLETQAERIIVLLLGDEKNKNFNQDARLTLCAFKDSEAHNVIQAKNPSQIFSEVMTVLSPIHIVPHPSIMSSEDKEQHITFISNKPFPMGSETEYVIELSIGQKTKEASASLFNPYTLLLPNPGHPPGLVTARIFICTSNHQTNSNVPEISRTQMGEDLKIWFQSDLDKVYSILDAQTDPISFLCQGLHEDPTDHSATALDRIDKLLTESFKQNVPDNKLFLVFGNAQSMGEDQDRNSAEYVPTLLHFSAMHGLRDLTAALLQCPGAVHAYGTANCEGDYPTNLAEKFGHWPLRDFMQNFMEVAAMVHEEYGQRSSLQMSQIMASMVHGQYVRVPAERDVPEDIYIQVEGVLTPISTPVGYLPMHPARPGGESILSDGADFMIRKMLQGDSDEPETEYEVLDPPTPDYDRRNSAVLCGKPNLPDDNRGMFPFTTYGTSPSVEIAPSIPSAPPPLPPPRDDGRFPNLSNYEPKELLPDIHSNVSPAQEELIALQKKVKDNDITINQAVFRFKEWERKHKERAASFQFQQENLQRVRQSLIRSREEKQKRGERATIKISDPIIAGSSTYGKVLLKTRKEVMNNSQSDVPYNGHMDAYSPRPDQKIAETYNAASEPPPRPLSRFRSSLRNSFDRTAPPVPGSRSNFGNRGSLNSTHSSSSSAKSSVRSSSSSSSFHFRAQPIPDPRRRTPSIPDSSSSFISEYGGGFRLPHHDRFEEDVPPPPIPPRDQRMSHPDSRPMIPPRSPIGK